MSIDRSLGKPAVRVAITLFATALLFVFSSSIVSAATINVPADHATLHDAVAAAVSGDVITVDSGSYDLPSQLVIDKDLTISGAGINNTVITTSFDTGSSGNARGLILVTSGVVFNIDNLEINGAGQLTWQAIRHTGAGGLVDSVRFTEIKFNESGPHYAGTGIAVFGTGPVDVVNSEFSDIGRIGAQFFGAGVDGSLYDNNTFVGKDDGDFLDYGVEVGGGASNIEISNSTISDARGVASSDGSTSAGVLVTTFFGAGTSAIIHDNNLVDNTTAIAVGFDASDTSDVEAFNNNIVGNDTGVSSSNGPQVNASCNWWGDASGPSGGGPGTGDSTEGDVVFTPWLTAAAPGGPCDGPLPPPPSGTLNSSSITISTTNQGTINNSTVSLSNTGCNVAGGAKGGAGGVGGAVSAVSGDSNNGGAGAGNGGNGGSAGAGGFVETGTATSLSGTTNEGGTSLISFRMFRDVNSSEIEVETENETDVGNTTTAGSNSGTNAAGGSAGGTGGTGGGTVAGPGDDNNGGATSGSGGSGGAGGISGTVRTGASRSESGTLNLVNTTAIRLR